MALNSKIKARTFYENQLLHYHLKYLIQNVWFVDDILSYDVQVSAKKRIEPVKDLFWIRLKCEL